MNSYRVTLLIHGKRTEVILGGANLGDVISTTKRMYPRNSVIKAFLIK